MIQLTIEASTGRFTISLQPRTLVIAGWTGRDRDVLEAHIEELAALGVARPKSVPIFYRVSSALLTTGSVIQTVGRESSGEVEAVLVKHDGALYVGVGSDHTDRKLEAVGISLSKQVCAKPISATMWPWLEVADHWDEVRLRSTLPSEARVYQEGATGGLRRPDDLLALYETEHGTVPDGTVIFCGTLPAKGGIRFSSDMLLELIDPVRGETISHGYSVEALPIAEA